MDTALATPSHPTMFRLPANLARALSHGKRFIITLTSLCIIMLFSSQQAVMQDSSSPFPLGDGWLYQKACYTEVTPPPDDWGWDGTVLMSGPYGIHGLRADWQTTRVMAFVRSEEEFIADSFSPDGKWYVRVIGDRECSSGRGGCAYTYNYARSIQVFALSAVDPHQNYIIPSRHSELVHHTLFDAARPTWIGDNRFAYYVYEAAADPSNSREYIAIVDVVDQTIEEWNGKPLHIVFPTRFSPDRTRDFDLKHDASTGQNYYRVIDPQTDETVGEIRKNIENFELLDFESSALWSPDSAYFLGLYRVEGAAEEERLRQLWLFDREGNAIAYILALSELSFSPLYWYLHWSPTGDGLLLQVLVPSKSGVTDFGVHLVDINQRRVTNLCASRYDFAWSPDGRLMATIQDDQLTIFDREREQWYVASTAVNRKYWVSAWQAD